MSLKSEYEVTLKAATHANSFIPVAAVEELLIEIEDFFTFIEDYDEWDAMRYGGRDEPEPGFTVEKLREKLGFDKEGN